MMTNETFARIPEGWFFMGSDEGQDDERPIHRVWVDAFDLAVYPVTCAQFAAFLGASAHAAPRDWPVDACAAGDASSNTDAIALDLPVVGVSWRDAQAYCAWQTSTGRSARLPTEAE